MTHPDRESPSSDILNTHLAREGDLAAEEPESPYQAFFGAWWFTFLVMGLISLLTLLPESIQEYLALTASTTQTNEWWRLLTCHFVHISFNHTILNLTGYFIIAYSFRAEIKPSFESIALLISCAGTGLGIHFLSPHMQTYYGLSGAIYGLLSCYALVGFRRTPFLSGLFLAFLAGKIAYEQLVAPPQITEEFIGGIVAVDAHLYGGFTGLLIGAAWFLISTMKNR